MYQLRNLINRTSVPSDPSKNMNAAEDFLLLLLHTHVVAAAKVLQSVNPVTSVSDLASAIAVNFVRLPQTTSSQTPATCEDGVHLCAVELLTLSLLWHGFHDAVKEGDGEWIVRYWKFLLVAFKSSNHPNYAKEAVHLLLQYYYLFSERQKAQLAWSRCINTKGHRGANIPSDLHMEHLNRRLKIVLRSLGANITPKAVVKAGKSIATVQQVCQSFEEQTSSSSKSDRHPYPRFGKDFSMVLTTLEEENVFVPECERKHETFNLKCGLLEKVSRKDLLKKVRTSIDQICLVK